MLWGIDNPKKGKYDTFLFLLVKFLSDFDQSEKGEQFEKIHEKTVAKINGCIYYMSYQDFVVMTNFTHINAATKAFKSPFGVVDDVQVKSKLSGNTMLTPIRVGWYTPGKGKFEVSCCWSSFSLLPNLG